MSQLIIEGLKARRLEIHHDSRGWLAEIFRSDELPDRLQPAMSYLSVTRPGVVRGPHEHLSQTDLFCFPGTAAFELHLWDNRSGSVAEQAFQLLKFPVGECWLVEVPPGVVHAYKNVDDKDGWVMNFPNRLYKGKGRRSEVDEVRHEDDPDSVFRIK